jgi:hypothetical protein
MNDIYIDLGSLNAVLGLPKVRYGIPLVDGERLVGLSGQVPSELRPGSVVVDGVLDEVVIRESAPGVVVVGVVVVGVVVVGVVVVGVVVVGAEPGAVGAVLGMGWMGGVVGFAVVAEAEPGAVGAALGIGWWASQDWSRRQSRRAPRARARGEDRAGRRARTGRARAPSRSPGSWSSRWTCICFVSAAMNRSPCASAVLASLAACSTRICIRTKARRAAASPG